MKKSIKKISIVLMLAMLLAVCLSFASCGENIDIKNHDWQFSNVQGMADNGAITHCAEEFKDLYPDAQIIDLSCSATDDTITITDNGTGESITFTYETELSNFKDLIYKITSEDNTVQGYASVGVTEYMNDKSEYTLIITIGERSLYFYEVIE